MRGFNTLVCGLWNAILLYFVYKHTYSSNNFSQIFIHTISLQTKLDCLCVKNIVCVYPRNWIVSFHNMIIFFLRIYLSLKFLFRLSYTSWIWQMPIHKIIMLPSKLKGIIFHNLSHYCGTVFVPLSNE